MITEADKLAAKDLYGYYIEGFDSDDFDSVCEDINKAMQPERARAERVEKAGEALAEALNRSNETLTGNNRAITLVHTRGGKLDLMNTLVASDKALKAFEAERKDGEG